MATKLIQCTCEHKYQNTKYGTSIRVHNLTKASKTKDNNAWRCTVCGIVREAKASETT